MFWLINVKQEIKNRHKLLIIFLLAGLFLFGIFFITTAKIIGRNVKLTCYQAQQKYGLGCVVSLMDLVNSPLETFVDRNVAIWALGQMGDQRAINLLKSYYHGHNSKVSESLVTDISQYELYKAIKLLNGGWNLSAWVWR
jgi:hypothetical protein